MSHTHLLIKPHLPIKQRKTEETAIELNFADVVCGLGKNVLVFVELMLHDHSAQGLRGIDAKLTELCRESDAIS